MKILPLSAKRAMQLVACSHRVERDTLHEILGVPHYIETDNYRTAGGEEDWWAFELPSGYAVAFCLRVPYQDVDVLTDAPKG